MIPIPNSNIALTLTVDGLTFFYQEISTMSSVSGWNLCFTLLHLITTSNYYLERSYLLTPIIVNTTNVINSVISISFQKM